MIQSESLRSAVDEASQGSIAQIEDAERDVGRAEQVARGRAHAVQEPVDVPFGRELQPDIDQRSQPRVRRSQIPGFLREFVGEQTEVLAIECRGRRRGL